MTPAPAAIEDLQALLDGRELPGGTLHIARHESLIADHALRAPDRDDDVAHPLWFVIASLRGMGISVTELCELAAMRAEDTLLLGEVTVTHDRPLRVGQTYRTTACIERVERHSTRQGGTLDSVSVTVRVRDRGELHCGAVTSAYLLLRGSR